MFVCARRALNSPKRRFPARAVYSFGVVMWELLTRKRPWAGMMPAQIICGVAFNGRRLAIPNSVDPGEKDATLAQKLDQPHPFIAVLP